MLNRMQVLRLARNLETDDSSRVLHPFPFFLPPSFPLFYVLTALRSFPEPLFISPSFPFVTYIMTGLLIPPYEFHDGHAVVVTFSCF